MNYSLRLCAFFIALMLSFQASATVLYSQDFEAAINRSLVSGCTQVFLWPNVMVREDYMNRGILAVDGYDAFSRSSTLYDLPDSVFFAPQINATASTVVQSNTQLATGINVPVEFTITNGTLVINSVDSGASGTFTLGDSLQLKTTSSDTAGVTKNVVMSVSGELFTTWSVQTVFTPIYAQPFTSAADMLLAALKLGEAEWI